MKGGEPAREVFSGRGGPIGNLCGSLGQRDNSKKQNKKLVTIILLSFILTWNLTVNDV